MDSNPYVRRRLNGMDKKCQDSIKFKELNNKLFEVKSQLEEMQKENVQLKTLQKRQEIEIRKLEDSKSGMPRLVKRYQEENRILNSKFRDFKLNVRELERKLKQKDDEIISLKLQNSHLERLTKDRNLLEREKLTKKVQQLESQINSLEESNKKLTKKCELEEKKFNSALKVEVMKHKETKAHLASALQTIDNFKGNNGHSKRIINREKSVEEISAPIAMTKRYQPKPKSQGKISNAKLDDVESNNEEIKTVFEETQNEETERSLIKTAEKEFLEENKEDNPENLFENENNQNGDMFSVENLDFDEIKKYVKPRKEELIGKIEKMFEEEIKEKKEEDDFVPLELEKKNSSNSMSSSSYFSKQFSTEEKSSKTSSTESSDRKSAIAASLDYEDQFDKMSDTRKFSMGEKNKKNKKERSKKTDFLDDNSQSKKEKKNQKADIMKYIFGKELLFESNPS